MVLLLLLLLHLLGTHLVLLHLDLVLLLGHSLVVYVDVRGALSLMSCLTR